MLLIVRSCCFSHNSLSSPIPSSLQPHQSTTSHLGYQPPQATIDEFDIAFIAAASFIFNMAPKPPVECAKCGTETKTICSGCSHAPEYQSGDSRVVFYCSRECQTLDWPNHQDYCENMQQRKILLRAAQVLKAAMLAYRETVYDVDLTKIEYRDGVLYLHQSQRSVSSQSKRGPFPNHLTDNIDHKEAALVKSQSTAATALLGPLTRKLLGGKKPFYPYLPKRAVTNK